MSRVSCNVCNKLVRKIHDDTGNDYAVECEDCLELNGDYAKSSRWKQQQVDNRVQLDRLDDKFNGKKKKEKGRW